MARKALVFSRKMPAVVCGIVVFFFLTATALAFDLAEIRKRGTLRHLGITYANFVTEAGQGLDVDLMRLFAKHLGVRYKLVKTSWPEAFGDLTGQKVHPEGDEAMVIGKAQIRGDVLANGLTILPWREKVIDYSTPTFPTGVWLVARADSPLKPITPNGNIEADIKKVMSMLSGHSVLTMKGTCLDPDLYNLDASGAKILFHTSSDSLNDIAPAVINGAAEATLLDIPDALVALQKWPGDIKVIGPVSPRQLMGAGFAKSSPALRSAFNEFFRTCRKDGTYENLVRKYYPTIFLYLSDFFIPERRR
jgi:ABC-type amino acid transport substrate-binding protein